MRIVGLLESFGRREIIVVKNVFQLRTSKSTHAYIFLLAATQILIDPTSSSSHYALSISNAFRKVTSALHSTHDGPLGIQPVLHLPNSFTRVECERLRDFV